VRMFDTGNARKTDPVDAHAVAMAALRAPKLKVLTFDEELVARACQPFCVRSQFLLRSMRPG